MDANGAVISIQIPDGAEPGDSLTFQANGQEFTIEVPVASVAGDVLQIQLGGAGSSGDTANEPSEMEVDSNNDEKITTQMLTGSTITIIENQGSKTSSDENLSDGTYQLLWPASRFIVKYINTPNFCRDILRYEVNSVLELGAGHGLLGMAFADVVTKSKTKDTGTKLILTDVEEALPQLQANIDVNQEVFRNRVDITALPLRWHSQPTSRTNSNLDFILGSDLLYNCSVIPDLVATIKRLEFKNILFSVRWRKPSEERAFFMLLSDVIDWKLIHGDCSLDYRFYGSGCFESNKFFSQTMVSVKGEVLPLSEIDEHKCEEMNTNEFERFEELQTQIYLGTAKEETSKIQHVDKKAKLAR